MVSGAFPLRNTHRHVTAPAISQGKLATEFVFEMYKSLVEAPELPKEIKKGTWKYYLYKNYKPPVDDFAKATIFAIETASIALAPSLLLFFVPSSSSRI